MNDLTWLQAIFLGALQGLTEFLPISSSGHLAIVQRLMDLKPDSESMILFDLALHMGTVVAVAAVFASEFTAFFRRLTAESLPGYTGRRVAWRIAALGVTASIPTAVIGLSFKDNLKAAFDNPICIGVALLATGTLLWLTGRIPRPTRGWRRFGYLRALLVGIGQGVAILPGISRSGTTICIAMLTGLKREWAGQFSFFIAIPAICGAALLQAKEVMESSATPLADMITAPLVAGTLAATLVGYAALRILMAAVRQAKLHYFCYYCWLLGLIVLIVLR